MLCLEGWIILTVQQILTQSDVVVCLARCSKFEVADTDNGTSYGVWTRTRSLKAELVAVQGLEASKLQEGKVEA